MKKLVSFKWAVLFLVGIFFLFGCAEDQTPPTGGLSDNQEQGTSAVSKAEEAVPAVLKRGRKASDSVPASSSAANSSIFFVEFPGEDQTTVEVTRFSVEILKNGVDELHLQKEYAPDYWGDVLGRAVIHGSFTIGQTVEFDQVFSLDSDEEYRFVDSYQKEGSFAISSITYLVDGQEVTIEVEIADEEIASASRLRIRRDFSVSEEIVQFFLVSESESFTVYSFGLRAEVDLTEITIRDISPEANGDGSYWKPAWSQTSFSNFSAGSTFTVDCNLVIDSESKFALTGGTDISHVLYRTADGVAHVAVPDQMAGDEGYYLMPTEEDGDYHIMSDSYVQSPVLNMVGVVVETTTNHLRLIRVSKPVDGEFGTYWWDVAAGYHGDAPPHDAGADVGARTGDLAWLPRINENPTDGAHRLFIGNQLRVITGVGSSLNGRTTREAKLIAVVLELKDGRRVVAEPAESLGDGPAADDDAAVADEPAADDDM